MAVSIKVKSEREKTMGALSGGGGSINRREPPQEAKEDLE